MTHRDPMIPPPSPQEGTRCTRLMRLAVVLSDWTSVEFEVSSYEIFADGCLVAHFEDGGVQAFRPVEWIDVHRPRSARVVGQEDAARGLPRGE